MVSNNKSRYRHVDTLKSITPFADSFLMQLIHSETLLKLWPVGGVSEHFFSSYFSLSKSFFIEIAWFYRKSIENTLFGQSLTYFFVFGLDFGLSCTLKNFQWKYENYVSKLKAFKKKIWMSSQLQKVSIAPNKSTQLLHRRIQIPWMPHFSVYAA